MAVTPENEEIWDSVNICAYGFDKESQTLYFFMDWTPFVIHRDDAICHHIDAFRNRSYISLIRNWRQAIKRYLGSGALSNIRTDIPPTQALSDQFAIKIRGQVSQITCFFPGLSKSSKILRAERLHHNAMVELRTAVVKASRKLSLEDMLQVVRDYYVERVMHQ